MKRIGPSPRPSPRVAGRGRRISDSAPRATEVDCERVSAAFRPCAACRPRFLPPRQRGEARRGAASLCLLVLALASGCFIPREPSGREDQTCTRCHGDASRAGDAVTRAAPPFDIFGNTTTDFPGVGAHARHLTGTSIAAPVACTACHVVPDTTNAPGHNDGVTQVVLAGGGTWNRGTRTCANSGCHGETSGVWTRPREVAATCGTCHGLPPPPPHPQAGTCAACHADVMHDDGSVRDVTKHVDGTVQVTAARCDACHGNDETGAPPRALDGGTATSQPGVGAHTRHLEGGLTTRPVDCTTCHAVPAMPVTAQHPDGVVQVTCDTACHFGAPPEWTASLAPGCAGCHGAPPPPPHPAATQCALCHPAVSADTRMRHVDGQLDMAMPTSCDGCHGDSTSPAPDAGAHRAHVIGRGFARVVQCEECHVVPQTVLAPGHVNGVTELRFSGVAVANGAAPSWAAGRCANSGCHDVAHFTGANEGGGTDTAPLWVDGSARTCTSCHGAPPPPPHPANTTCESCHSNVTAEKTFISPEKHVNGAVDF